MNDKLVAPRRFRGIRKQVNMFLLTALAGFAGLVSLVAYKQGVFEPHTTVYFHAPDATGITKGMAVRLHGVPVGAVRDVQLVDRGVRVRLAINSQYIPQMPRGAQARLTREGYVGAASIQILPGTAATDRTPIAEGDEIRFLAQKGVADMLDEVRQQMTPAFQELRKAAAELADPNGDFRKSMSTLRELIDELPPTTRELRQLVRNTDRTVVAVGGQAENTLSILARVGAQTESQLPIITSKLAGTLDSLNATAIQAHELMRGGGELVRDTHDLTQAARRTWLLRDYIEPSQMRTLPVDSFESFGKSK